MGREVSILTCYTPYFRLLNGLVARPVALARCVQSVANQRGVSVQHELVEDRELGGSGVGGMFAQVPANAHRVTGDYVVFLADDDELTTDDAVRQLAKIIEAADRPDVVIVSTEKGHHGRLPYESFGPPVSGRIDLNCVVTRRDVWLQHVHDYGNTYEGDFAHASAMWNAGRRFHYATELLLSRGAVSGGAAE